ncbi:hypothetical protein C8Q73DRAFT_680133 [Cubamyces lactineus]|nr:hypothetical protein C8Q73DRAFT_680133 [Cubamyces lactineus]
MATAWGAVAAANLGIPSPPAASVHEYTPPAFLSTASQPLYTYTAISPHQLQWPHPRSCLGKI